MCVLILQLVLDSDFYTMAKTLQETVILLVGFLQRFMVVVYKVPTLVGTLVAFVFKVTLPISAVDTMLSVVAYINVTLSKCF